jgi:hypothetical protein
MALEFEQLYSLGTDVAAFMFYHPESLKHRAKDELDWWARDFQPEFRSGSLAAFYTGCDREFVMKFVQRPLTSTEATVVVSEADFRFDVRDQRFYWDNSDALPSEDQLDNPYEDENGWVAVASGSYRLTVYALDWFSISEAERESAGDISHFIVRMSPVDSFDGIPVPDELPWLIPSKAWHEQRLAQLSSDV